MNLYEAHARFAIMCDRGDDLTDFGIANMPEAPLLATALASCSGWLMDAADDAELLGALAHGRELFHAGVITEELWGSEVDAVFRALDVQCGPTWAAEQN